MEKRPPKLRNELLFSIRNRDEKAEYQVLIEDPVGGGFLETDRETAAFLQLLNGERTAEEALQRLYAEFPGAALSSDDVPFLLQELGLQGLLAGDGQGPPQPARPARIGPVVQKLRLGTFDSLFRTIARRCAWAFGPTALIVWLMLVLFGAVEFVANGREFAASLGVFWSLESVLWLWLAWIISKIWHELQHGVVARLHGVEVREAGVLLVLFVPLGAYVDVSGAWRLESRWKRLHITLAGIMGEFALSAVAILLWVHAPEGEWRLFLQAIVVATTVSTVLFNANPLMRFDGYYALVDLLDVPNLYQRGMTATRGFVVRLLTGQGPSQSDTAGIALYGWLSLAWRISVACTLVVLASHLFFGFGLVLALFVIWSMFLKPAGKLASSLWSAGQTSRRTLVLRTAGLAGTVMALWFLPVPTWFSAPGIVEFYDSRQIRSETSGQVVEIFVGEGDRLQAGDPVVLLANPSLSARLTQLESRYSGVEIEISQALDNHDSMSLSSARKRLEALGKELGEARYRTARLLITAPQSGMLIGEDISELTGTWTERGGLIGEIANPRRREVHAWLLPEDAEKLRGTEIALNFFPDTSGEPSRALSLQRISPAASTRLPPPAITAEGGGPLMIDLGGPERQLVEARFEATFLLNGSDVNLQAGTPGKIVSTIAWVRLGQVLENWFTSFDPWALAKREMA